LWKGEFAEASKNLIGLEAGSAIEEIQNCHIGIYMEGYLTHRNLLLFTFLLQHRDSLGAAFLRRPYPSNFFKNLYKG
jgi:hypothetical protein